MGSAFENLTPADADFIRRRLLAGDPMSEIRAGMDITAKLMRELRDEVFEPLLSDPEKVKELAAGPCLNPLEILRYRRRSGRKPKSARSPKGKQIEMFPT